MSVVIPWSRIASASAPRPMLFSGNQEGSLGGPSLQVPRMGDRFAIDVETTQLRQDAESRILLALLTEATTADARIAIFQPDRGRGINGTNPVVDGAGQSGSSLRLRGGQPNGEIVHGRFFTVVHAGIGYLHFATARVFFDQAGAATVPIWPMLRFLTVDGEPVELAAPYIEGQLSGFADKGGVYSTNKLAPLPFTITERA